MARHVDVYMNGVSLRSAAPKIWIKQVSEDVPAPEMTTAAFPGWDGERPVRSVRRSLRVTITATIHEVFNLAIRAAALDTIAAWAGRGGVLTVSYRPGRRLRVVPTGRPALGKVRDYTQEITVEFTAYAPPLWEDALPVTRALTAGTSGEATFSIPGSADTPLEATVTASTAVTAFALMIGGRGIFLSGLSLAADDELVISHTDEGFLTITADGVGVLGCRSSDSEDDLILGPGANTVSFEADGACAVTLKARGRYR